MSNDETSNFLTSQINLSNKVKHSPKVTIGMLAFNGEKTIEKAINSLLFQTFKDFELIISNDASTDRTGIICEKFALEDSRINYICQDKNIGEFPNSVFLLNRAKGKYFMWAADDDWRSPDFLMSNVIALDQNSRFVASTSPSCYEGEENMKNRHVNFNLKGTTKDRYKVFLENAWNSHGIYYSLMRTEIAKKYKNLNSFYAANDWSFNFYLITRGQINRSEHGLLVLGKNGQSRRNNPWKYYRNNFIEIFLPLYEFSKYALSLMTDLKLYERLIVYVSLLKLNFQSIKSNLRFTIRDLIEKKKYEQNNKKI
jgi:glycosyltransferase involved in cell wall biosynthesis